jgi:ATP-dependent exoDNAse (exonuclease V) beta subunit
MNPVLHNVLSLRNCHGRDIFIQFFEENHKYVITCDSQSSYTSVTTWNHSHFPHFDADNIILSMMKGKNWKEGHKYWGMTPEQIKNQWNENRDAMAGAGTNLHYKIECFMNNPRFQSEYFHKDLYQDYIPKDNQVPLEWQYFIQFVKDTPYLKPFRTEWTIFDEDLKLAGSIDMVYENPDGTLSIYDWKRSKNITAVNTFNRYAITESISHMPDANLWHYALQLNTYKAILERKYGYKVKELVLIRLHPDAEEKTYELISLPDLKREIAILFEERMKELIQKTI